MMKLLIDIGNSRIKWALLIASLTKSRAFAYNKASVSSIIDNNWRTLNNISAIYVSNVASSEQAEHLSNWAQKTKHITPVFIVSEAENFGITNGYLQPSLLGSDRWLALIAARQHSKRAVCVIDCGTAITIDVITKDGVHQGGMIVPGLSLMRESLVSKTSGIANISNDSTLTMLSFDTQRAAASGALYTALSCLKHVVTDINKQLNDDIDFMITGGDADKLTPLLSAPVAHYPDLVLEGLAHYAANR